MPPSPPPCTQTHSLHLPHAEWELTYSCLLLWPPAAKSGPCWNWNVKRMGWHPLGRSGLTCQRKDCGKSPLSHSPKEWIPLKEESFGFSAIISSWLHCRSSLQYGSPGPCRGSAGKMGSAVLRAQQQRGHREDPCSAGCGGQDGVWVLCGRAAAWAALAALLPERREGQSCCPARRGWLQDCTFP